MSKRKYKKWFGVLVFTSMLFVGVGVHAQLNDPVLDLKNEGITIDGTILSGKEGRLVDILVTNPGYSDLDIGNKSSIQYKNTIKTGENGYFSFKIGINSALLPVDSDNNPIAGNLTIYVGGDEGKLGSKTIYFAPSGVRKSAVLEIKNAADKDILAQVLEKHMKNIGVDNDLFAGVTKEAIAAVLFDKLPVIEIDEENIQDIIMENALLAAFNESKTELIYKNEEFLYKKIMMLDTFDADNNCTFTKIFSEGLTEEGRKIVVSGMLGKNVKTIEELNKIFAVQITLKVSSNLAKGYGVIGDVLTINNAKMVEGLDLTKYLASDTAEVNRALVGKNFEKVSDLQSELDKLAKENPKKSASTGGLSGNNNSSGGKGSTPGISQIPVVAVQNQEEHKEIFNDISDVSWAEEAIYALYEKGVINGMGDGRFEPNTTLKREQLAKIICLGFGINQEEKNENKFLDVNVQQWYYPSVNALYNAGIMKGVSETEFGIGAEVTRQDIAVVIYRLIANAKTAETEKTFTDNSDIAQYAKAAVNYLVNKGIIKGFEDGSFRPRAACTRAQAVKLIYDALKER